MNLEFGSACVAVLRGLRTATGAPVHAYCLMPDHVHLLVGASETISVVAFVQRWKSLCYREWVALGHQPRSPWQRSFWDHGLRVDEDLIAVAKYILRNPVRAGMVDDFHRLSAVRISGMGVVAGFGKRTDQARTRSGSRQFRGAGKLLPYILGATESLAVPSLGQCGVEDGAQVSTTDSPGSGIETPW